ncbi:maltose acetyltransferase domain-containing protein, partial [Thomasclavelia sp.]|uniref:maltose acetyltransferase domain-containing protein n=1 Tax=Thomasclavelia sp. TaxID=3025757 RepID=UPI0025F4558A
MNEKEKMINGLKYDPTNYQLVIDRTRANRICTKYNKRTFCEINMRSRLLKKLIHASGNFWIKPPIYFDYGYNIYLGKNVMLNYGCVILDVCPVKIGDHTLIGPGSHIYTACHSLDIQERKD